jgi:hypothetical protein
MQKMTAIMSQGETLKPQEDGIKSGRTEQSGYQFKKYRTTCRMSVKHFVP